MSLSKKVAKNSGIVAVGMVIDMLIKLGLVVVLARYLGAAGYGQYNTVIAFIGMFTIITEFGLNKITLRDIAKNPEKTEILLGNMIGLKLALSAIAILVTIASARVIGYSGEMLKLIELASITILFPTIGLAYDLLLEINLKMKYYSIANIVSRSFYFALIAAIVYFQIGGIFEVFYAYILMSLTNAAIIFLYSRQILKVRILSDLSIWKEQIKEAIPLGVAIIFITVYSKLNLIILSRYQGDAAVGLYSAAFAIIMNLAVLPIALQTSLFPIMSGFVKNSTEAWEKAFHLGLKFLVVCALPVGALISYGAAEIIGIMYGSKFLPGSANVLSLLAWMVAFNFINLFISDSLITMNRQKTLTKLTGVFAFISLSLTLILVPRFSEMGLAMASVATEVFASIALLYTVSRISDGVIIKDLLKIVAVNIPVFLFLAKIGEYSIFVVAPVVGIAYLLLLFLFKIITDEEILIFKGIIKKS